jgi:hypothetical protein
MRKVVVSACLVAAAAWAQYKLESAGAPPSELAPAIREALVKDGVRVVAASGKPFCEIWLRSKAPSGAKTTEENVSFTQIPTDRCWAPSVSPARGPTAAASPSRPASTRCASASTPWTGPTRAWPRNAIS